MLDAAVHSKGVGPRISKTTPKTNLHSVFSVPSVLNAFKEQSR